MNDWLEMYLRDHDAESYGEHPESGDLVLYVEDLGKLAPDDRIRIEKHLQICLLCEDDIRVLREVAHGHRGSRREPGPRPVRSSSWSWRGALMRAASVALLLWVGSHLGSSEGSLSPVQAVDVQIVLREDVERGADDAVLVPLGARSLLTFRLPTPRSQVSTCRVRIEDARGRVVVEVPELSSTDEYGSYGLLIDTSTMGQGSYILVALDEVGEQRFAFTIEKRPR